MDETAIYELSKIIQASENIVFFGGAGVSTESNIPDFRSEEGIYNIKSKYNFPPETMLSHSFFINQTSLFYDFYKTSMIFPNAKPNLAHLTLAKLEQMGKLKAVITQNIDGLHQAAGSYNVLELHGSVHRNYCMGCNKFFDLDYVLRSEDVPLCDVCSEIIKPDVVLYDETKNWLYLIEAVTTHGPIDQKRIIDLEKMFENCSAGNVYVTAFPDRPTFRKYIAEIAWETEVWISSEPDHMIHFNGDRFMGPHYK